MKKWWAIGVCGILLFTGCASAGDKNGVSVADAIQPEYVEEAGYGGIHTDVEREEDWVVDTAEPDKGIEGSGLAGQERKKIKNISLIAETLTYEESIQMIEAEIAACGGYAEELEVSGKDYNKYALRSAQYVIRIPASVQQEFVEKISKDVNILSRTEQVEDITARYTDIEAHKAALQAEQERLLELVKSAEDIEILLAIETKLTDIRYELEGYAAQLRNYDNQVEYSTVRLSLREVIEVTETEIVELTVWQKMGDGLMETLEHMKKSIQNCGIWIVTMLPYLCLFGIVILVITILWKRRKKRRDKSAV